MADDREDIEGNDLAAIIGNELRQALSEENTALSQKRERALEYIRGEMRDLPARPHGSTQTSRDFADTVSWILPGIVRVFTASDQMVKYDKVKEEDDRWSREATEYTNYTFFRENDGYRILYNGTYDGLVLGNGVACSYWEPPKVEAKSFPSKTAMEIAALLEDGWQPAGEPKPGKSVMTEMGEEPTYSVKMQREKRPGKICDETLKPDNLLVDNQATTLDDARFVAYLHDDKTRSDLLEMADYYDWDREAIEQLPAYHHPRLNSVDMARRAESSILRNSPTKSGELIDLYHCFVRADKDGDGVAELLEVWYAGNPSSGIVLSDEEYDDLDGDQPFTDIPCYPVPHRWDAESVFDRTEDIQRVKTVLLRQGLDNTYAHNLPMREVEQGSVLNPDILVNPKFHGIIWKKVGSPPIVNHETAYIADKTFAALAYMDEMVAKRTGVSRNTMALDPEALQNQTATAAQQQRDAGYSQIELIARNMAELGWAKFFAKRLKLAIKYQQVRQVPVTKDGDPAQDGEPSQFMQVDPSKWDANMAVSINVGLGTGSRDRDMAMLNNIMMGQIGMADRLGAAGFTAKAIEFIPKIRNTAVRLAESSGLKNPEEYYPEITDEEVEQMKQQASQPQPDPAVELEKVKGEVAKELKQFDGQITLQTEAGKNQLAAQQAELDAQGEIVKNQAELDADLATKEADRQNAIALAQLNAQLDLQKQERELAWKTWDAEQNRQLEREKMENAVKVAAAKPKPAEKRPGA